MGRELTSAELEQVFGGASDEVVVTAKRVRSSWAGSLDWREMQAAAAQQSMLELNQMFAGQVQEAPHDEDDADEDGEKGLQEKAEQAIKLVEAGLKQAQENGVKYVKIGDSIYKIGDVIKAVGARSALGDVVQVGLAIQSGSAANVVNALADIVVGAGVTALVSSVAGPVVGVSAGITVTEVFTLTEVPKKVVDAYRAAESGFVSFNDQLERWILWRYGIVR